HRREAIQLPKHRLIRAAREAAVFLVEDAEREQRRRLELGGVVRLLGAASLARQGPCHAYDLEAPITKIVGLLGVEREDAERQMSVRRHERHDRAQPEQIRCGEAVATVRRPEARTVRIGYGDDRVEKGAALLDPFREPTGVHRRELSLERRRGNRGDWQYREH